MPNSVNNHSIFADGVSTLTEHAATSQYGFSANHCPRPSSPALRSAPVKLPTCMAVRTMPSLLPCRHLQGGMLTVRGTAKKRAGCAQRKCSDPERPRKNRNRQRSETRQKAAGRYTQPAACASRLGGSARASLAAARRLLSQAVHRRHGGGLQKSGHRRSSRDRLGPRFLGRLGGGGRAKANYGLATAAAACVCLRVGGAGRWGGCAWSRPGVNRPGAGSSAARCVHAPIRSSRLRFFLAGGSAGAALPPGAIAGTLVCGRERWKGCALHHDGSQELQCQIAAWLIAAGTLARPA